MQVLGLCRFSWPAIGGFQTEHKTIEERVRFLYAQDRLDERFRIFEAFTLPSLLAQSDGDFTLIVVIGDSLPVARKEQLSALLERVPQAVLHALPPGQHRTVMQQSINAARRDDGEPCIQFRMDDDDAIGRHFIREVRAIAADVRPLIDRNRLTAIDFTRGHSATPTARGVLAEPTARPYLVPGLAVVARPREPLSLMNFNHVRLWQFMPTVTLHQNDMFVRGVSRWNDSGFTATGAMTLLDSAGEAQFRQAYGIDAARVREIYRHVT